jgi:hypothetical protein
VFEPPPQAPAASRQVAAIQTRKKVRPMNRR